MLFPMDNLHVSETWKDLSKPLQFGDVPQEEMLKRILTGTVDVLFSQEEKVWFFVSFMATEMMPNWKVMVILSGWVYQGSFPRKHLLGLLEDYGEVKGATGLFFNQGCPWVRGLSEGVEWQRLKW